MYKVKERKSAEKRPLFCIVCVLIGFCMFGWSPSGPYIYYMWLVVWNMNLIFPYIGNNNPNWLIFFRGLETTNQYTIRMHNYWWWDACSMTMFQTFNRLGFHSLTLYQDEWDEHLGTVLNHSHTRHSLLRILFAKVTLRLLCHGDYGLSFSFAFVFFKVPFGNLT
jgi:hypothetical protein